MDPVIGQLPVYFYIFIKPSYSCIARHAHLLKTSEDILKSLISRKLAYSAAQSSAVAQITAQGTITKHADDHRKYLALEFNDGQLIVLLVDWTSFGNLQEQISRMSTWMHNHFQSLR